MPIQDPDTLSNAFDLVVVGAGVSGLYTAWRYLQKNPDADVIVLDRLNRPGGRLQTDLVDIETDDGETVTVREEEGGMRFNYTMTELMALFGALGLCDQIVPFPMQGSNNRYHFRGRSFTDEQAHDDPAIWSELFDLKPKERNRAPVDILSSVFHRVLRHNNAEKPADADPAWWQYMRLNFTWDETPLYQWQLWGLMREMDYSEGCCQMLAHALGFEGPFFSRMNAGEAFQLLEDFPANPTYYTFREGFSTLPNALVDAIEAEGGHILLSTNIDEIDAAGSGYELQCTVAPSGQSSTPYVKGGQPIEIEGSQVVLAVARKALEDLWHTSPVLNRRHGSDPEREAGHQLWEHLQTATDQPLLKINLYYRHAWWRSLNKPIAYGPSFSDLPVGSVYPFYAIEPRLQQDDPTQPPPKELPAALTIYCDWDNTNFWKGLQEAAPDFASPLQRKYSNREPQRIFPASEAVVDEATELFELLYSTPDVPAPIMTSFRLWDGSSDFGYAVHQWGLGAKDDEVMEALVNPMGDIYTCGEAFSDMQGWVNGALRSADRALRALDDIPPLHEEPDVSACPAPSTSDAQTNGQSKHSVGRWGVGALLSSD